MALSQPRTLANASKIHAVLPIPGATQLTVWTKGLLSVLEPMGRKLTVKNDGLKPLVSKWQKLQRGYVSLNSKSTGLRFTVACTKLKGVGTERCWNGSLILIYERETQSLFHHIVDLGPDPLIPPGLIWFVLAQAMKKITKAGRVPDLIDAPKTVLLPVNIRGNQFNPTFKAAAALFQKAKNQQRVLGMEWRKNKITHFDTAPWTLKTYIGRTHLPLTIKSNKVSEPAADLRHIAAKLSAIVQRGVRLESSPTSKTYGPVRPSWKELNTARVEKRKDPSRFSSKTVRSP